MINILEVREFDCITGNPDYAADERYRYLPEPAFSELITFIHDFTGDDMHSDALELMKISYKRNIGNVVTMSNYVGIIQLKSGYQIQILPKIAFKTGEQDKTKQIFIKMLRSMRDFPSKMLGHANLLVDTMNLYEIFISMYIEAVAALVKHGLKSGYVPKEENERFFKGKLLVKENIKKNSCHKERFFVSYDEYQLNRAENKLIKSTLLKLQKMSTNMQNVKQIRQLLTAFELVEPSSQYDADFAKCVTDRTTAEYDVILKWSKVFLTNKSFTSFSGNTSARALLFPMEKVFESYVAQKISRLFNPEGVEVSTQDSGYYLFDDPQKFKLRPDIVLREASGLTTIMDTKWKRLFDNPSKNYGISQSDMYQMYAYAKKYSTPEHIPAIWLLYPANEEMQNNNELHFDSDDGVRVRLFFVDLVNIDASLELLLNNIKNQSSSNIIS
jgi:5-methylcytosine-specific restriction enzyme subunit McrC